MMNCEEMEGLIAASLYETLEAADNDTLQTHLAECVSCRTELASLRALVGAMSAEPAIFQGDLLPALREELRRSDFKGWHRGWRRYVLGFSAAAMLACVLTLTQGRHVDAPTDNPVARASVDPTVADARALVASDNAAGALALLKDALATEVDAARAGMLQLEVAELEFSALRRYDAAYDAYSVVRDRYAGAWTESPGIVKERFDLLTEAREANFEPLYQIDAAVKQGDGGIPTLEQLMARYPGRGLAQAAMETMVAMSNVEGLGALEDVRSRLSNPVAVAQLDVRLGEGYCAGDVDPAKGKALLHAVAESPYEVPAQMAKDVLARLETGTGDRDIKGSQPFFSRKRTQGSQRR